MNRREFLKAAGVGAAAIAVGGLSIASIGAEEPHVITGLTVGTTGSDLVADFATHQELWRAALDEYRRDLEHAMLFGERSITSPQTVTIKGFTWTEAR